MTSQRRVRLEIYGKVQGVFFRASTREKAREHGITGWVKNRRDGSVEAVCEGPDDAIDELIEWAHQGPTRARVDRVESVDEEPTGEFTDFKVRR